MRGRTWGLRLLLLLGLGLGSQEALPPPCESQIYCHGELLHQVQMAKLYQDDKQFVDMPLSLAPDQVLRRFRELAQAHNLSIPRQELQAFVQEHFRAVGQELQPWTPGDWRDRYNPGRATGEGPLLRAAPLNPVGRWSSSPQFLQKILDPKLRAWAGQLHQLWKKLGKKMKPEVLSHPEQFSLIYSRHPFIVPGGRFVEFYYWDSYWVMEGLLLSEMPQTVKGMLQNFLDLVQTYGHVPNGARVYYLQRSQPPLLTLMMDRYVAHTNDTTFLRDHIETLASELDFWSKNRSISVSSGGKSYILNHYEVPYGGPRPESYSKDAELAATLPEGNRDTLLAELKAGAESGWDFSSRWLLGGPNLSSLSSIRTSKLVPVDLNAFLCQAEGLMSNFYARLGNDSEAAKYRNLRAQRMAALKDVLWDEGKGAWFDYDLENDKKKLEFYPSNFAPLWAGCFSDSDDADKALKYLESSSCPQYDISNGGQPGGGGEYEVQEGFGWTNGVALMLLDRYGDRLSSGVQTAFLEPHCLAAALLLSLLPQ
ncbi:hypothetical protein G4228_000112 [Cervus hanglu yarkandensis]|nr:hypothetical protein G4228_000112 [Cervus hanglu yarkandensis]